MVTLRSIRHRTTGMGLRALRICAQIALSVSLGAFVGTPSAYAAPDDEPPALKFGPEVAGYIFGSDSMGAGGGARVDFPVERWVFGATLGARGGLGTERPEGRVRLVWLETEASARIRAFRVSTADVRFGLAVAPFLVFPRGIPSTDAFQAEGGVNAAIAGRLSGEVDIPVFDGQSLLTRVTFGAPLLGFIATLENGRPIGGLAEWELSVSVAWLWPS